MNYILEQIKEIAESDGDRPCITALCDDWQALHARLNDITRLDANAYAVLAKLLGMASNEFGNHGCNDFALPNTPENYALLKAAGLWNTQGKENEDSAVQVSEDGTELYTQDWFLMEFFAHLAQQMAGKGGE